MNKNFQAWCKSILPAVEAGAEGQDVQFRYPTGEWQDFNTDGNAMLIDFNQEYRPKPKRPRTGTISNITPHYGTSEYEAVELTPEVREVLEREGLIDEQNPD